MEKKRIVFYFDGKTYQNFKDYGKAIADRYYPFIVAGDNESAKFYYKAFCRVLENSKLMDLSVPSVVAAYNYCRWFYSVLIANNTKTDLLLELYLNLHEKIKGKTLIDKLKEEGIIWVIKNARGF